MSETKGPDPTGRPPDRRKLIAVAHMDMAGYSRLIGLDDAGTLKRLRALRSSVIDPAIDEHGGKIVQTGGDSLLIVFDSIDGAVRCAVKVQQQVPIHDADCPPDRAIRLRVGINLGDAIADGTDLHGDAVNVAARLQAECPPGGICVSRSVRDHVHGRLDLVFEELGPLSLKNIARPIEVFVVRPVAVTTPKLVERSLVHNMSEALPLPGKPSIAVLAFTNMSGDLEQEYFSDGIADDIITELSRSRSLFVIARNSSFAYRGLSVDVRRIARELGVRYVVEGSVRRSGGRIRVTAQLIDAETGNHIWAKRYDRALEDVFAVQDDITSEVTTAVLPAVADAEQRRALRRPPESLSAWEALQRGLWHLSRSNPDDNGQARKLFGIAIRLDAAIAAAYSATALTYLREFTVFSESTLDKGVALAETWARKAVEVDPNDYDAQAVLAFVAHYAGRHEEAWERMKLALAINQNSPMANRVRGAVLLSNGCPSDGRNALLTALRLDPRAQNVRHIMHEVAVSYYFEHDYAGAVEAAKRVVTHYPNHHQPYRLLAAALGHLGRKDEAVWALQKWIEISPQNFERYKRSRPPWSRAEDHEHMLEGLRKAGWHG